MAIALEVGFASSIDAARAWSRDLSAGGIALQTTSRLPVGTQLQLVLHIPAFDEPLEVEGEVAWSRDDAMGIAFRSLAPEAERRIRELVALHSSVKERVLSAIGRPPASTPAPARLQRRDGGVRLFLNDALAADVLSEILRDAGYRVLDEWLRAGRPDVVVADPERLEEAMQNHPGVPLVLLKVSGPDALVGRLSRAPVSRFVPRSAPLAAVCDAVRGVVGIGRAV